MPAFGVVSLVVGPTTFTYNPSNLSGGSAFNVNRAASSYPSGFQTLQRKVRGPVNGDGLYRVQLKLNDPVALSSDTACGCAGNVDFIDSVNVEFVLSEKSTEAMRSDLRKKLIALLGDASVVSMVDKLEYVYA